MKLQTRLTIAFLVTIFVPLGLGVLAFYVLQKFWPRTVMPAVQAEISSLGRSIPDLLIIVVIILLITALLLAFWLHQSIVIPLGRLSVATKKIKEGDLEFKVQGLEEDDEIGQLYADFEEMRERLATEADQKLRDEQEHKELISNISHDLKTPITAIKGYVEGIMDGVADSPEKMDRYIKTIYNKANEMDRLINELSFYTKIDTNRIPYVFNTLNVSKYFNDCAEDIQLELQNSRMYLRYTNHTEPGTMMIADAEQLRRVISNIVSNSIKYMDKPGGWVQLDLTDVGDFIQVDISDNGKGIALKDLPNIFDRFYRTDASRSSSTGGSGIGLSIVKKIVEDHGGTIWATSKLGIGTTISFVLRKDQENILPENVETDEEAAGKGRADRSKARKPRPAKTVKPKIVGAEDMNPEKAGKKK